MSFKTSKFIAVIVLIFFISNTALAATPYIPSYNYSGSAMLSINAHHILNYYDTNQLRGIFISKAKGVFGESVMNNYFTRGLDLASDKRWYSFNAPVGSKNGMPILLAEGAKGVQGIDGAYIQFNSKGDPTSAQIVESKFGSSRQKPSQTGLQGSLEYNAPRIKVIAQHYERLSQHIQNGNIKLVSSQLPKNTEVISIPLSDKKSVKLWWDGSQKKYLYSDSSVEPEKILSQSNKISTYLNAISEGRILYKNRLFKVNVESNGALNVSIIDLKDNGHTEKLFSHVSGKFSELPKDMRKVAKDSLFASRLDSLKKLYNGVPEKELKRIAQKEVERLEKNDRNLSDAFKTEGIKRLPFSWSTAGKMALRSGTWGAISAVGFRLVGSLCYGLPLNDFSGFAKDAAIGFTSAAAGTFTTTGVNFLLKKTLMTSSQSLIAKMAPTTIEKLTGVASGIAGGLVATAIFSYGYAFLYGTGWQQANRMMISGSVATVVASSVTYGVGTLLAATSGWFSFGASTVAYFAVSYLFSKVWTSLDEKERIDKVEALIYSYHD